MAIITPLFLQRLRTYRMYRFHSFFRYPGKDSISLFDARHSRRSIQLRQCPTIVTGNALRNFASAPAIRAGNLLSHICILSFSIDPHDYSIPANRLEVLAFSLSVTTLSFDTVLSDFVFTGLSLKGYHLN